MKILMFVVSFFVCTSVAMAQDSATSTPIAGAPVSRKIRGRPTKKPPLTEEAKKEEAKKAEEKKAEEKKAEEKKAEEKTEEKKEEKQAEEKTEEKKEVKEEKVAGPHADRYGKKNGSLYPFEVGPKISIGLPIPPAIGVEAKWRNILGASFDFAYVPTITIQTYSIGAKAWDFNLRIYPFSGSFFLGGNIGRQDLTGSRTDTISSTSVTLTANNTIVFTTPHIGWRWVSDSGFFWGMELGAQIALNVNTGVDAGNYSAIIKATPQYQQMLTQINQLNNYLRRYPMPLLAFQIGFLF